MGRKNKKFKGNHKPQQPYGRVRPEVMPALDLGYLNAATVTPPDFDVAQIILVGAGGLGAYMAQHIGRLMRVLYQSDKGIHLTIVDPDVVEEKNLGRQLFCDAEVGQPKAEALMRRYGQAWGLNVSSYVGKFDDSLILGTEVTVIVGCVDNAAARQTLAEVLEHNPARVGPGAEPRIWWLDCGNLKETGRVLLGTAATPEHLRGAFPEKSKCVALPGPHLQSPGLLQPEPEELEGSGMSCAEMAAANLQSLNINARVAAEAADFITRLLVTGDLKRFACELNIAAGTQRSIYSTPEEVARVIGRAASFLDAGAAARAVSQAAMDQDLLEELQELAAGF